MPIYEFACSDCQEVFEELVRADSRVACPACGSVALRRLLSSFAAPGGARPDGCQVPECEPGDHCGGGRGCTAPI